MKNWTRITVFMIILGISLSLGIIAWYLGGEFQTQYVITTKSLIKNLAVGGAGFCPRAVFDGNGKPISVNVDGSIEYDGPAPLYWVEPYSSGIGCNKIPPSLTPSDVKAGQTAYPLYLEFRLPKTKIHPTESIQLETTANISQEFAKGDFVIPISTTDQITMSFSLNALNFEFSPRNEEQKPILFGLGGATKQKWIVVPKSNALGDQVLIINLDGDRIKARLELTLEVQTISGISPQLIGWIVGIGAFLAALAKLVEPLQQIITKFHSPNNKKGQKKRGN